MTTPAAITSSKKMTSYITLANPQMLLTARLAAINIPMPVLFLRFTFALEPRERSIPLSMSGIFGHRLGTDMSICPAIVERGMTE